MTGSAGEGAAYNTCRPVPTIARIKASCSSGVKPHDAHRPTKRDTTHLDPRWPSRSGWRFAILCAAVHSKENDFEICVRLHSEKLPILGFAKRAVLIVLKCTGK